MKIESKDKKIENIFRNKKYIIPEYQRSYSWEVNEEISLFWNDFTYYLDRQDNNFFIGPMVFMAENIDATEFEVIDGQQRLITFSILLSVLVSLFRKYNEDSVATGLNQYLIFKDKENKEQLVIETEVPHPFFQKRIFHHEIDSVPNKGNESEVFIEKARVFFESSLEEYLSKISDTKKSVDFLKKVRDCIFDIDVVVITSNSETDAFTIFETINTRGKNLSSLDLLKNYIFKNFVKKAGVCEPQNTWKEISKNIKVDPDSFFNRFWSSRVSKVTENKLYRRFGDFMRSSEEDSLLKNTSNLLEELRFASEIYRKISTPKLDDWRTNNNQHIYTHIKNINGLFGLRVHYPFFMTLLEEYENKKIKQSILNETLLFMENFHFIFTHMVSSRPSGLDNKYSKFAIRIRNEVDKNNVINDLKKELLEKVPSFEEYRNKFNTLNYKDNKDTIKFILLKLEKENDSSAYLDLELHSIEHLLPRSVGEQGVDTIGNLFLLEQKYNETKDILKPFDLWVDSEQKTVDFLSSNTKYKTTKNNLEIISKNKKWNTEDIKERTERLAIQTYEIFSKL